MVNSKDTNVRKEVLYQWQLKGSMKVTEDESMEGGKVEPLIEQMSRGI